MKSPRASDELTERERIAGDLASMSSMITPASPSALPFNFSAVGTPFGLTPMFSSGYDPWANTALSDVGKALASLPGTPGTVTPTQSTQGW